MLVALKRKLTMKDKLEKTLLEDGFMLVDEDDNFKLYTKYDYLIAIEKESGKQYGKAFRKKGYNPPCHD